MAVWSRYLRPVENNEPPVVTRHHIDWPTTVVVVPTFTVEEIFDVKERGPAISRSQDESKAAWARGERWKVGQLAVCGKLRARVVGIERFRVPEGHPAHNDGGLLLADVSIDDLKVGQVWEGVPE